MKCRKLRIAWSVAWRVAAVLLLVLWARSGFFNDNLRLRLWRNYAAELDSDEGSIFALCFRTFTPTPRPFWEWRTRSLQSSQHAWQDSPRSFLSKMGFQYKTWPVDHLAISTPLWFLVVISATPAAIPWLPSLPNRFSLRTLLIATTLVAVGLGLVVWAIR